MNSKRQHLAERRAALISKAERQRVELAEAFSPLQAPLAIADKGIHAFNYLAKHPFLIAGAVALAVLLRSRNWLFGLGNGLLAWRMVLKAKRSLGE